MRIKQERQMASFPLERKSSIELEPLTLSFADLQLARESALHVMNTKPLEEAIKIFTEGLQPVNCTWNDARLNRGYRDDEEDEDDDDGDDDEVIECWPQKDRIPSFYLHRTIATAPF